MTSSIKQRKSVNRNNIIPHYQSPVDLDSSDSGQLDHSTNVKTFRLLVLVAFLFWSFSLFLRSPPSLFSSTQSSHAPPLPLSALVQQMDKIMHQDGAKYGDTPLAGVYTFGEDHQLQKHAVGTASKTDDALVTGSIRFPHVDLSNVLTEEATRMSTSPLMIPGFSQSVINQVPEPSNASFLSPHSTFKSAIANNSRTTSSLGDGQALLTRRGYKMGKVPNQDRSLIAKFDLGDKHALLMGIFDGHGPRGHVVSHFIALELPRIFAKIMREKQGGLYQMLRDSLGRPERENQVMNNIRQALNETFVEVDAHEPVKGSGGSTASTFFYPGLGSKVYIANSGDSTTIFARFSKSKTTSTIMFENRKHKPHLDDELERIRKAGGQVMIPPSVLQGNGGDGLKETSRVIIPDPSGNPFGGLALAMSRSIGDFDGRGVGLIPEPDVIHWDVNDYYKHASSEEKNDSQWFAVVASDGVYDLITPEIVVEYLGLSLYQDHSVSQLEACERIIREASRRWMKASMGGMPYRDDITIGVSKVNFALS